MHGKVLSCGISESMKAKEVEFCCGVHPAEPPLSQVFREISGLHRLLLDERATRDPSNACFRVADKELNL